MKYLSLFFLFSAAIFFGCSSSKTNTTMTEKKEPQIVTTPSGLQYVDYVVGTGPSPQKGQKVTVTYAGKLTDSTQFDANTDGFSFTIGVHQVISGWDEGVMSMKVGGSRTLIVPSDLGYGARGAGAAIPPNATLVFDVELLEVK